MSAALPVHSESKVAQSFSMTPTMLVSNVGNSKGGYSESISETAYDCEVNFGVNYLNWGCRLICGRGKW